MHAEDIIYAISHPCLPALKRNANAEALSTQKKPSRINFIIDPTHTTGKFFRCNPNASRDGSLQKQKRDD